MVGRGGMCVVVCSRQEGFSLLVGFDSGWFCGGAVLALLAEEEC